VRCFDSSIDVTGPRRFSFAHHLRECIFYPLLAPDQKTSSEFELAGERRCEQ
jgi:hypothetical protein